VPKGPEVAFNAYIASCTLFLNLSYAAPVLILLIRGRQMVLSQPPEFSLGRVKGYIANYTAVIFVAVTSVVSSPTMTKFKIALTDADIS
jgi:hypothetical protein